MTQENQGGLEWLKIFGGSFLVAVGFFFLFEAFDSIEVWKLYKKFQESLQEYEQQVQEYEQRVQLYKKWSNLRGLPTSPTRPYPEPRPFSPIPDISPIPDSPLPTSPTHPYPQDYRAKNGDTISDELPFLDNVPALVILGIPMLIMGSALSIKGIKEYLR